MRQILNIGLRWVIFGGNLCRQSSFVGYCETSVDRKSRPTSKQAETSLVHELEGKYVVLSMKKHQFKFFIEATSANVTSLYCCNYNVPKAHTPPRLRIDGVHHVQKESNSAVSDINLQRVQSLQVRKLVFSVRRGK